MVNNSIWKIYSPILFCIFSFLSFGTFASDGPKWATGNPFRTNVFVENVGQFDNWCKSSSPVRFAVNNGSLVFFTAKGVTFRLDKAPEFGEEEREERERKGMQVNPGSNTFYISMEWEGGNPNPRMEVSESSEGYYTFGEKGYEKQKLKGYKKLIYKDLYPGIDIEYTIPEKGGVKSVYILHPGADLTRIKVHYSGDVEKISKDRNGNVRIKSPGGEIVDHAPQSYYEGATANINSNFLINGRNVSFSFPNGYDVTRTLMIDPWTTTLSTLTTDHTAYDVAEDNAGNVYVSGGSHPYKLAKYNNTGGIIWTYTVPIAWGTTGAGGTYCYAKFGLLPNSGTTFISEGYSSLGARVMKMNSDGTLQYTSANFPGSGDLWVMFCNNCTGQIIGFGGGLVLPNNLQVIADTNLSASTVKNFNGYTGVQNDVTSAKMDDNGDFYALMTSSVNASKNRLMKSLVSTGYTSPCFFDVPTGYNFGESTN